MIVGGYDLHLYCRYTDCHPAAYNPDVKVQSKAEFHGPNEAACRRQARARGWVFNNDSDVTCYHCGHRLRFRTP